MSNRIPSRTLARWRAIAGSNSSTPRGIIRAALDHLRRERERRLAYERRLGSPPSGNFATLDARVACNTQRGIVRRSTPVLPRQFHEGDRAARRAAADPAYLASTLNRAPRSLDEVPKWVDLRKAAKKFGAQICTTRAAGATTLSVDAVDAERYGIRVVRRGADWDVRASYGPSRYTHSDGETQWRNGRPIKYTRAKNITYVRAYAIIVRGRAHVRLHNEDLILRAPTGYRWDIDIHGLRLSCRTDATQDYHPTATELLAASRDSCAGLVAALEAGRVKRQEAARAEEALRVAEQEAWICRSDALRAGNCAAGTDAWIAQHALDGRRHYPLRVLALIDRDNPRFRLAAMTAAKRHIAEMERGYALLSDHGR